MSEHEHHHHHHHHGDSDTQLSMGTYIFRIALSLFILAILVSYGMTFQVPEGKNVVITRFQNPIRTETEPGLHFKLPWPIDRANPVDMRRRIMDIPAVQLMTKGTEKEAVAPVEQGTDTLAADMQNATDIATKADKVSLIVFSYVIWEVKDPLQFRKALGTTEDAELSLRTSAINRINVTFRKFDFTSFISTNRSETEVPQIEKEICEGLQQEVSEKFGVNIVQVGLKRIAFPEENIAAVLESMRKERNKLVSAIRVAGDNRANEIVRTAQTEAENIKKEGSIEAARIQGEAELEAARIRSEAYSLNPKFYEFWRTLQALRSTMGPKTTLILRNDSGIFKPIFEMPDLNEAKSGITAQSVTLPSAKVEVPPLTPEAAENLQNIVPAQVVTTPEPLPVATPVTE